VTLRLLAALVLVLAGLAPQAHAQRGSAWTPAEVAIADLPREARETISLIRKGGPYPHARDGVVFGNREGLLPKHPRGYYREFTVRTPGERSRGARRIVSGKRGEFFYSSDHYNSFRRVRE